MIERREADAIVERLTEVSRPHALTIMSAEQRTMSFRTNVGPQFMEPIARKGGGSG
ncbi:hypothetical protein WBG99_32250 [Streptomyces sp. TG1A-60]|uniref:hypothetical protein n=1 Tax=Streptomyces sp. TG1A-60 TaxID=3129111 RepID=UPI0030D39FC0